MAHYEASVDAFAAIHEMYECRACRTQYLGRDAFLKHRVMDRGRWRCLSEKESYRAGLLDSEYSLWELTPGVSDG